MDKCPNHVEVDKLSLKVPTKSEELVEEPHIPETIIQPVQLREEITSSPVDTSCQALHYIPDAETRPVTALVSFPGSGNTWLRYLIQQSTGILTGSQFVDNTLMSKGFPGEPVFNASVAVVKTHQRGKKIRDRFQKAVLLIRHPKPAIQSLFNLYSQGHTGCASKADYERLNGNYWKRFVRDNIMSWKITNTDWINKFKGPIHIVLYDQLRNELGPTLRSLVEFLDLPLNETAIQCTVKHSEGLYHRNSCMDGFDPFTDDMNSSIDTTEKYVFGILDKYENIRKYLA